MYYRHFYKGNMSIKISSPPSRSVTLLTSFTKQATGYDLHSTESVELQCLERRRCNLLLFFYISRQLVMRHTLPTITNTEVSCGSRERATTNVNNRVMNSEIPALACYRSFCACALFKKLIWRVAGCNVAIFLPFLLWRW